MDTLQVFMWISSLMIISIWSKWVLESNLVLTCWISMKESTLRFWRNIIVPLYSKLIYCLSFNLRRVSSKCRRLIRTKQNLNVFLSLWRKVTLLIGIFDKWTLHLVNWLEQVIVSPYCYCLNHSLKNKPFNDMVAREDFIPLEHMTLNENGLDLFRTMFMGGLTLLFLFLEKFGM